MKRQPGMHKLMAFKSPILALTHIISHYSIFWLMLQKKFSLTRQHYFQCEIIWATNAFCVETEDVSYLDMLIFFSSRWIYSNHHSYTNPAQSWTK